MAKNVSITAPAQVWRVGNFELGFIKVEVPFSKAVKQVPKGWCMASSNEVSLGYRDEPGYQQALMDAPCAIWTRDTGGIEKSGERIILEDGSRAELKPGQKWSELEDNERAYEYAGSGHVAVGVYHGDWMLDVAAGNGPRFTAWVAVSRLVATPKLPKGVLLRLPKGVLLLRDLSSQQTDTSS